MRQELGAIVLLLASYVGAYYATVLRGDSNVEIDGFIVKGEDYRLAPQVLGVLFRPMNRIDRAIRPEAWYIFEP